MLDRVELVPALAKKSGAVAALQSEADELLACIGAWLTATDADALPMSARLVASELEPSVLAQELQDAAGGRSPR